MNRLIIVGVDLVGGKPDLKLPADIEITRHDANHFVVEWADYHLTMYRVGKLLGQLVFACVGDEKIMTGLAHLGASVKPAEKTTSAERAALVGLGVRLIRRRSDDAIVGVAPRVVFAGDNPIKIGLDGDWEEGEEYYLSP